MTDTVSLTPDEVRAADHDTERAYAEAQRAPESGAPSPAPPTGTGATSPAPPTGPSPLPTITPPECAALLEAVDIWLPEKGPYRRLTPFERERLSVSLAPVLNRYAPWLLTNHPELVALAITFGGIVAIRVQETRAATKAEEAAKAKAAAEAAVRARAAA